MSVMSADDLVERVANDLADGRPIDWDAVIASARSDDEREQVESLRLVSRIIQEHRSSDHPANGDDSRQDITRPPDVVLPTEGEEWGRFRLLEKVGAGSFGSVYRAFDPDLDREIAIKILHRSIDDSLLKERLLKEGRALAKVRHSNVVSVFGVESYVDHVGLCMEFIRGETLETEIQTRGTFSESQTVEVGKAICQALSAVHRAGFVHRDVKARNIMRERDTGRIVLMDFGTGREIDQELTSGGIGIAGTAIYMAPEVLAGQPASPCSDVYSVGVLLYYLLTAAYPVEGGSLEELRTAHMVGLRTPLSDRRPDLGGSFVHVVDRTLAANRQQRHSTPGALFEELEKVTVRPWRVWPKYLTIAASAFSATALGLTGLGVINTRYFNTALGRSEYANETIADWFYSGVESSVAPIVLSIFAVAALALMVACKRLVTAASTRARAFEKAVLETAHRWRLDDVSNLSSCVLLVSALMLIVTWWHFAPLFGALVSINPDISTAPLESLSFLSPKFRPYHENYRLSFIWVTIASCMLWYPAVKLAIRKGESLIRAVFAGGAAVLVLSLLLLDFPYRFIYRREFEAATWQGHRCYVLGERADDFLLFCPQLPSPRNRRVSQRATDLQRAGVKENIFSLLSPDSDRGP